MGLSFLVESGGKLDVDLDIFGPRNELIHSERKQYAGGYNFVAELEGRHTYCFFNERASSADKVVSFTVTGTPYFGTLTPKNYKGTEDISPVEKEIASLNHQLRSIKDDQFYIITRERTHRDTAESTNSRVLWWSIFQLAMLFAVCYWQLTYLKRFFEVKRVI